MIGQLIGDLAQFVPGWVLVLLLVAVGVLMAPGWLVGLRVKRQKALLRRVTRASGGDRDRLIMEAWEVAEGRPEVLIALAKEADKMNLPALRDRAIAAVEALGSHHDVVKKLRAPTNKMDEKRRFGHPVEAAVSIERLLEVGATEAARERLAEARARFPDDEVLRELQGQLPELETAS
jgi:hypothetical protein